MGWCLTVLVLWLPMPLLQGIAAARRNATQLQAIVAALRQQHDGDWTAANQTVTIVRDTLIERTVVLNVRTRAAGCRPCREHPSHAAPAATCWWLRWSVLQTEVTNLIARLDVVEVAAQGGSDGVTELRTSLEQLQKDVQALQAAVGDIPNTYPTFDWVKELVAKEGACCAHGFPCPRDPVLPCAASSHAVDVCLRCVASRYRVHQCLRSWRTLPPARKPCAPATKRH